jgi:S1-C subfamily serine protease
MNAEPQPRRLRNPLAVALVAALAVGVVGGHYIWTSSSKPHSTQSASRQFGPLHSSLPGGFKESCNASGCKFSFGNAGSSPGSGSFPGAGLPGSGSGSSSGGVASAVTGKVDPALVDINTDLGYEDGSQAAGTGMVVSPDGEVITNNHVILAATTISATDLGNGRTYTAKVIGYDYARDVAVLQLEGASGLKTVTFANSDSVKVGQSVATIGNAGGAGGTPSAVGGTVSGIDRSIMANDELSGEAEDLHGLIELNGGLEPGDSGGPLVNNQGEVLGMDTAASSTFVFSSDTNGFAIPIDEVEAIAKSITTGTSAGTVHVGETGFLGVTVSTTSSVAGALVESVVPGTPAAATALGRSDVITAVDGSAVTSPRNLTRLILQHQPGDTITLSWRTPSGSTRSGSVKLASGPPQ